MRGRRNILPAILAAWITASLACNFPVVTATLRIPRPTSTTPAGATLASELFPTRTPTQLPETPPKPGNTAQPEPPAGPGFPGPGEAFAFVSQPGDTLDALAKRFGVESGQITSSESLPPQGLVPAGRQLSIPNTFTEVPPYPEPVLPDAEVVYSPTALDFDLQATIQAAAGYLAGYTQLVDGERISGADAIQRAAWNTSVNPRLLLALVEFRTGWVTSNPPGADPLHPLDFQVAGYEGLYLEASLAGKLLNIGYYGWRQGSVTEIKFAGGGAARLDPRLNPGTAALQYLFARLYHQNEWYQRLYGQQGFLALYASMFGDAWSRAAAVGPLFPVDLQAPLLELPFAPGQAWSLTAGPHPAWNTGTPNGALDFGPITGEPPCSVSTVWVTASAPGVIARIGVGVVLLDLDGDGREQTGWVLLYQHIAASGRIAAGTRVNTDDRIGHPSCEGGDATGSHVHLARKYNGEWIPASADWPLVLSGWLTVPGEMTYLGTLVKDGQVVTARGGGTAGSRIVR